MHGPDGVSIMHAELQIGDSIVMLGDEYPDMGCVAPVSRGGATGSLFLYVPDVDAAFIKFLTGPDGQAIMATFGFLEPS